MNELAAAEAPPAGESEQAQDTSTSKYETLRVYEEDNMTKIVLNRPAKKNALNYAVRLTIVYSSPFLITT